MKLLLCVVNLLPLLLLIEAAKQCRNEKIWNKETSKCETPKCPPGQVWYEDVKACAKFNVIATGLVDEIASQTSEDKTICQRGFKWVQSLKLCVGKPEICADESCHSTTPRPQTSQDC